MNKAVYIQVDGIEARPMEGGAGTLKRDLLQSEYLEVRQIIISGERGPGDDCGIEPVDRMLYVLEGKASLRQEGRNTEVGAGHLMVVPRGVPWGPGLLVTSGRLTLLEIVPREAAAGSTQPSQPSRAAFIRIVRSEDVQPYRPAGHVKTVNRCLFQNGQVEIIEGSIEPGGGADEHLHEDHEQMLYVLEGSERPLLIYYPKGTPHGTGGGISVALKLLVIYSPPLGEAHSVLRG